MSGNYRITFANRDQLERLQQIELAAAELFSGEDVPESVSSTATSLEDLASAQNRGMLWTALTSDGTPVGFAIVRMEDGLAYVQEVDVHPDHGRRGIGTSLIQEVCAWAKSQGIEAVTLTTFRHLPWNAPFYERLGFRPLGQEELTPGLATALADEAAMGLDPAKRMAMLKRL